MPPKDVPVWMKMAKKYNMSSYNTWHDAGLSFYGEKEFIDGKVEESEDGLRLVNHLPIAARRATSPAIAEFTYRDNYKGFEGNVQNAEGITILDTVQALTTGKRSHS